MKIWFTAVGVFQNIITFCFVEWRNKPASQKFKVRCLPLFVVLITVGASGSPDLCKVSMR
jgi:hypothetical protein